MNFSIHSFTAKYSDNIVKFRFFFKKNIELDVIGHEFCISNFPIISLHESERV